MDNIEVLYHRYAGVLFEIAGERKAEREVMFNLEFLNEAIKKNEDINKILRSPIMEDEQKITLLRDIAKERKFSGIFVDFLKLLVKKRRMALLNGIFLRYTDFYNAHKKRVAVFLKSACGLEYAQLESIKALLAKKFNKDVLIHQSVEPSLVGGLSLKVGDRIYDTSVRIGLIKLREVIT